MLDAESEIEALGEGSTGQTELNRARLSTLEITVPARLHAESSGQFLMRWKDEVITRSGNLLRLLRDTLPKLMTGELRVRNAEKVVEDVT